MTDNVSKDELLTLLYYDLEKGFGSAQYLYRQAKEERATIHLDDVKQFSAKQPNKQRKAYKGAGNSYVANYAGDQFQADIGDMLELHNTDTQERSVLAIVDIVSKYGMAIVLDYTIAD